MTLLMAPRRLAKLRNGLDIHQDGGGFPVFESAQIENHVNFTGAVTESGAGFRGFGLNQVGPERETNDGANFYRSILQEYCGRPDVNRIHTNGTELMQCRFLAEPVNVGRCGSRFKERMVDEARNIHDNDRDSTRC